MRKKAEAKCLEIEEIEKCGIIVLKRDRLDLEISG
jgi:hypothetical protein